MRLFGTDGIRAPYGEFPLDPETILHLGYRLGSMLADMQDVPEVIMAGDTRASTPEICRWLATGLDAADTRVHYGGVLPTPAIATLVKERGAAAGISISASHNPYPDNGIKLFDADGFKWSPDAEQELELLMTRRPPDLPNQPIDIDVESGLSDQYLSLLQSRLELSESLEGLKVVLDTAHGAATPFAAALFSACGADVVAVGDRPDGRNINRRCGSTAPEAMAAAVVATSAHFGVAFDGDADRALMADELGAMRDGDAMLYLWARYLLEQGILEPSSIVATTMSNLGLELALDELGISLVRCDVGDRHVVTTMRELGLQLGGEQSGHLVYLPTATTGDGLSTALQMAMIVHRGEASLSSQLSEFRRLPQVLKNVRVASKPRLDSIPAVVSVVQAIEARLGDRGRLVLRYSGTEPLARVMIEGQDQTEIEQMADEILESIRKAIGESSTQESTKP